MSILAIVFSFFQHAKSIQKLTYFFCSVKFSFYSCRFRALFFYFRFRIRFTERRMNMLFATSNSLRQDRSMIS